MPIVSYNFVTTVVKLVFKIHREKARKWLRNAFKSCQTRLRVRLRYCRKLVINTLPDQKKVAIRVLLSF